MFEANPDDLEIVDGVVRAKDAPTRSVPLSEIAATAYLNSDSLPEGADPVLDVTKSYQPDEQGGGWAATTHVCFVEVDPETGVVTIPRYLVVEDCGKMINPAVVEGQIRGGIAQGIGGMLFEHAAYDDEGQFLVRNVHDLPRAYRHGDSRDRDPPPWPSRPDAEVDFRGVGEGGAIIAPAAIANAVEDALTPFGVTVDTFPLTPTRILEMCDPRRRSTPG